MMFSGIDSRWVPRAQVSVRVCRQVGQRHPALDAGGHGLGPAQLRHRRQQARRNAVGHQHLGAGHLLGGGLVLARQGVDHDPVGQAGGLDRIEIGGGRVGPEQNMGAAGHDAAPGWIWGGSLADWPRTGHNDKQAAARFTPTHSIILAANPGDSKQQLANDRYGRNLTPTSNRAALCVDHGATGPELSAKVPLPPGNPSKAKEPRQ